ncbi:G-type lectin S-receptor-like serine/threonine-protein kinase At1g67520 [Actinidia eriantha]|uniref:G-type lectin S-receptor-like serine/threonine-protein kinase At1g67520 n=1 Tax=Actinidia eriantha TaxID=165200 RepID=UPI002590CFBF|nr:G-type lectin S-receptor-like serine/threonine-protein kinase At1g67520 [Actinidia eriantha]
MTAKSQSQSPSRSLSLIREIEDTLAVGQAMRDWEFLESANKLFRVLFFSLEVSNSRYLGIQFMNYSMRSNGRVQIKLVWVANHGNLFNKFLWNLEHHR